MLPEFYSKRLSFPRYFYHKGMIYEWSGEQFPDISALVFEVKATSGSTVNVAELMEELPNDSMFAMLLAIYYSFSLTILAVRTQILDDETHVYVTCSGVNCRAMYDAWNNEACPLFTSDVCKPTHLISLTNQPWSQTIHTPTDLNYQMRGEMTAELRKPMNWHPEYRFVYGYGINVHYGISECTPLDDYTENYFDGLEGPNHKADPLPVDASMSAGIHQQIYSTVAYNLDCLTRFLSPSGLIKTRFTLTWIYTTLGMFSFRNVDMTVVAQPTTMNDVYVKTCTLYDMIVEPLCKSGMFFTNYAPTVDWEDIYHCLCRIYTALMSNANILMLASIAGRTIITADNKQYIGVTMYPMPINFAPPAIIHRDSADIMKFLPNVQQYFFVTSHDINFAFPVCQAEHDDFILCLCRLDTFQANKGDAFDWLRSKINNPAFAIEMLADTDSYLYLAIIDANELHEVIKNRKDVNRGSFKYSFLGYYGCDENAYPVVEVKDVLKFLITTVSYTTDNLTFLANKDPLYADVLKRYGRSHPLSNREGAAYAWADHVNLLMRGGIVGSYIQAFEEVFPTPEQQREMVAKVFKEDGTAGTPKIPLNPTKESFWDIFRKRKQ